MKCKECGTEVSSNMNHCPNCGASCAGAVQSTAVRGGGNNGRQDNLVYPKNPPMSPHLALLSFLMPGLPQLVFGQVGKGLLMMVVFIATVETVILPVAILIFSIIDAYKVGNTLKSMVPVGKWQIFPSAGR